MNLRIKSQLSHAFAAATLIAATVTSAQTPTFDIPNPHPDFGANFARNLMTTPDGKIITGAQFTDIDGFVSNGIAYVIDGATGAVIHELRNPEPATDHGYGAFAWAGDTRVAVSAFWKPEGAITNSGRVYIFDLATGAHVNTISNPTPAVDDFFGYGLGMIGDTLIVSSRGNDEGGLDSGAVYLIDTAPGGTVETILNPEYTSQDNFGYSVAAIGGNKIAIGAPNNDTKGTDTGAVFVYDATSRALLYKIYCPDPTPTAFFGFQVRARGNDIIVGAPGQKAAYVFNGDNGNLICRLLDPDPAAGQAFGSTVAALGDYVLVGDPLRNINGLPNTGQAFLFSGYSGKLIQVINNPSPEAEDRFGVAVSSINGTPLVSADHDTVNGISQAGRIYLYPQRTTAAHDWTLFE